MSTQKGFTLIEVLTSAFVFSIISIEIAAIFVQVLNLERSGLAAQKIQENALYVLELMAREIRVSQVTTPDNNCTASVLNIVHPVNGSVNYFLQTGGIVRRVAGGVSTVISTSGVDFTRLSFCVKGCHFNDNQTPRVAILATIQTKTGKKVYQFDIQTTVSSRDVISEFQYP